MLRAHRVRTIPSLTPVRAQSTPLPRAPPRAPTTLTTRRVMTASRPDARSAASQAGGRATFSNRSSSTGPSKNSLSEIVFWSQPTWMGFWLLPPSVRIESNAASR